MDPTAKPFVFNSGASEWAPPAATPPPAPPAAASYDGSEDPELWAAVLAAAGGDAAAAAKLLADPDALLQYPAIAALALGAAPDEADEAWDAEPAPLKKVAATEETKGEGKEEEEEEEEEKEQAAAPSKTKAKETEADVVEVAPEDPREHLNVVFIGHVDAGKSTLSGNILYLTGYVDKRTIEKYEREAKQRNRESWFLAFIMDTNEEERAKGKTVEVGRAPFETEAKRYTILDAPGHKNYVPNMISGAAQADVGILVISARRGEFETGFERGGQTREHAMLAKTLGVRYLIVVINKMDEPTVGWKKERFDECVSKLKPYLKTCGYTIKTEVKFIPISALTGANVLDAVKPSECAWWAKCVADGENNTAEATLVSCLDALVISGRSAENPLRVPVLDRYYERGTMTMGKVESGRITCGDSVMIMPTRKQARVDAIFVNETTAVASAKPGENINVKLAGVSVDDVSKGFMICAVDRPIRAVTTFTAQLALVELLEHRPIFSSGYTCIIHAHTVESECVVTKLISQVNMRAKGPPRPLHFAKQGAVIIAQLAVTQSICLENFDDMNQLGRFTLRDEGRSIAIGKIISLDD